METCEKAVGSRERRGALHVLTWCNSLSSHFVPSQIVPQYRQNFSRVLKEVTYVYTSFFKLTSQKKGRFTSSSTLKLWNNLTVKWNDLTMERGVNPWFKHPFPFKSLSRRLKSFLKSRFLKVSRKAVVVYTQDRGNWNSFADSMTKLSDNKTKWNGNIWVTGTVEKRAPRPNIAPFREICLN